jgi:hypothetical protein
MIPIDLLFSGRFMKVSEMPSDRNMTAAVSQPLGEVTQYREILQKGFAILIYR